MNSPDITAKNIAHWDDIFAGRAWGKYPPEELVRFVARTFRDVEARKNIRALEVGCGPGANLWFLAREGFAVSGIDGSSHAIEEAGKRLRSENVIDSTRPPDLRIGNFATLPWSDGSFDAVIDICSITSNTMQIIRSAISEVHRVLKPGGWHLGMMFEVGTLGADSGNMIESRTTENPTEGPFKGLGVIHFFNEDEIRKEFSAFSEIQIDWLRRSDRNGSSVISYLIVQARK